MNVENLLRQTLAGLDRGKSQSKNEDACQADQRDPAEPKPQPHDTGGPSHGVSPHSSTTALKIMVQRVTNTMS